MTNRLKPTGRRDLAHLDGDHKVDAEPDRVDPRGFDHGKDHRRRQDHDRHAVEEAAERDEEDGEDGEELVGRQTERADEGLQAVAAGR